MSVRIQFDISDDEWLEYEKYAPDYKIRHHVAREYFREGITRRRGRDKRAKEEALIKDANRIQEMLDAGLITINQGE